MSPDTELSNQKGVSGFTLVELMVAMLVGMLLLSAVVNFFTVSRTSFERLQATTNLQETVGMLSYLMTSKAHSASHIVWDEAKRSLSFPDDHASECTRYFIGANQAFSCDANHNQALVGGNGTGVVFDPKGFVVTCIPNCDTDQPLGIHLQFVFTVEGFPEAQHLAFTVALRNNIVQSLGGAIKEVSSDETTPASP